jgi:ATP-dependent DNA helicase RecG
MTPTDVDAHRTLVYLSGISVENVKGVGAVATRKLNSQGIFTVADLLLSVPRRYLDRSKFFPIGEAPLDEEVTISGIVTSFFKRRISRGRTMVEARVSDATGSVRVVWFNPYIKLTEGEEVALSGKLEHFRGSLQMKGADIDRFSDSNESKTGRVLPVYGALGGLKPDRVRPVMENAVRRSLPITDVVPAGILEQVSLVDRTTAFRDIHMPDSYDVVAPARRRLIFDEFLRIQMALRVRAHDAFESRVGIANARRGPLFDRFIASLPYTLTQAQRRVLDEILDDMASVTPMHRLLQGEVGSGKTVVVIAGLLASVESGHQGAVMAPTEVLATQHYLGTALSLANAGMAPPVTDIGTSGTASLFEHEPTAHRPVRIGLFTSGRVAVNFVAGEVSREQGLDWLADGTIDIAFGTQALIQEGVGFASLGITVVDEQHRFGVEQRVVLRDAAPGDNVPDLLLMTATPIPRTLAMTLYGDLDVSVIDEIPPGRSPIVTVAVGRDADDEIDAAIAEAVAAGNQVFVVCPLVDDSDKIEAHSAVGEFSRVSESLPSLRAELLHGQMRSQDKAEIMARFVAGDIDVLVSTTVIEVGIDVPNATLMVIRDADRFGLSQLHQLRGRIGRGTHGGRCILSADTSSGDAVQRMEAMVATTDGFALARIDLEIRGQGTVFAGSQSGAADLTLGDILVDHELLEAANRIATQAVIAGRESDFVSGVMQEVEQFFGRDAEWLSRS